MRTRAALAVAASAVLALAVPSLAGGTPPLPVVIATTAHSVPLDVAAGSARWPVFNAAGRQVGSKAWRTTSAGGNCCEVYIDAARDGRLLEFGGSYPTVSSDSGRSWTQAQSVDPLYNGEGALVSLADGRVFGTTWDFYTGDHLQGWSYDPAAGAWTVSEVPLHSTFYDRPWITYAKGPFTIGGRTFGFLTLIRGGSITKDPLTYAGDGVNYGSLSTPEVDELTSAPQGGPVPVVRNPDADWDQPVPGAMTTPLSGGGLLADTSSDDASACPLSRLGQLDGSWHCYTLPGYVTGSVLRQDSRGWLTMVSVSKDLRLITLRLSANGGRSWHAVTLRPPHGGVQTGGAPFLDVKVNGALGLAVVDTRVQNAAGDQQDMVFRVDIARPAPRLTEIDFLGNGQLNPAHDVSGATGNRMDFPTVAIRRDGTLVMAYDDTTTLAPSATNSQRRSPATAIELPQPKTRSR